jgi:hypothetical protein
MEELLRYAIESGSFGISLFLVYYLFKKFIKKEIVEPINDLKEENTEIKKSFIKFTENINGFVFKILKSNNDTHEGINLNISNMNNLFTESTRHTSQAKIESYEALEKVNVLKETTDKLLKIATIEHEKNKNINTEVQKLSHDMIMVKNKIGLKNED